MYLFNVVRAFCVVIVSSLLFVACQSVVKTDIETFREEKASFSTGSVRVVGDSEVEDPSLEFAFYRDKLEAKLAAAGYQPTRAKNADFVAKLGYRVSRQEKDHPSSRVVLGGHIGGFYPRSSILVTDSVGRDHEYVREVSLAIDKNDAGGKIAHVVQVRANSVGKCEHLTVVYDEMLDAIFSQLMRANGSIVKVSTKGDLKCP